MEVLVTIDFTQETESDWINYIPDRTTSFSPPCRIQKFVGNVLQEDIPRILFAEADLNDPTSMFYAYHDGLLLKMSSSDVASDAPDVATFGVFIELPKELAIESIVVSIDYDWVGFQQGPPGDQPNYLGQVATAVTKSNLLEFTPERPPLVGGDTAGAGQQFAFNILDHKVDENNKPYRWFGTRLNSGLCGYYDEMDVWHRVNYAWIPFDSATAGFDSIANFSPDFDPDLPAEAAPSNAVGKFTHVFSIANSIIAVGSHGKAPVSFTLSQSRPFPPDNVWWRFWDWRGFDPPERQYYAKNFETDVQDAQFAGAQIQTTTMSYGDPPWSPGPVGVRLKSMTVTCKDKGLWTRSFLLKISLSILGVLVLIYTLQIAGCRAGIGHNSETSYKQR